MVKKMNTRYQEKEDEVYKKIMEYVNLVCSEPFKDLNK